MSDTDTVQRWMGVFGQDPTRVDAALEVALAMARLGQLSRALEWLALALQLHPHRAELHTTRGNLLRASGDFPAALAAQDEAVRLAPQSAAVHANRCVLLLAAGRFAEALEAADRAVALAPHDGLLHFNRGTALLKLARHDEARIACERAAQLLPSHAGTQVNLGEARVALGDVAGAEAAFERALALEPQNADAAWNLSLRLLARGEWARGWAAYEARRRLAGFALHHLDGPSWDGAPMPGQVLLITAEQGLGDTFQFCRWLSLAQARSQATLIFEVPRALLRVLRDVPGVEALVARGDALPRWDAQAPLLSLPHLCRTGADLLGQQLPVLCPEPDLAEAWRQRLAARPGWHVGVCFQGNPAYLADRQRSVPLAALLPLTTVPGVHLASVQKHHGREQVAALPAGTALEDLGATLDDATAPFVETAAALASMDLLISSDTATPHLAGALGKEVWLLLPHQPDWRWGPAGSTTPWYPRWRVFRQPGPGDWASVVAEVRAALIALNSKLPRH